MTDHKTYEAGVMSDDYRAAYEASLDDAMDTAEMVRYERWERAHPWTVRYRRFRDWLRCVRWDVEAFFGLCEPRDEIPF